MKREGRQHGMVRTRMVLPPPWNSRPKSKVVNELTSPPTAGRYAKVPTKPTNHPKFTGKCGTPRCMECHTRPACKSRDKAKGTHKLKSFDVTLNHQLITWRVMDKGLGLNWDEADCEMDDDPNCVAEDPSPVIVDEEVRRCGTEIDGDDVGLVWDLVDDEEDWCLVGEM